MNKDSKRLIVFIIVSFVILFGFNKIYGPKPQASQPVQSTPAVVPAGTAAVSATSQAAASTDSSLPFSLGTAREIKEVDSEGHTVETPLVSVTFSNIGGVIQSYKLKAYTDTKDGEKLPVELVPNNTSFSYLALNSSSMELFGNTWKFDGETRTSSGITVAFKKDFNTGLEVRRSYTLQYDSYLIDMKISFINRTGAPFPLKDFQLLWGPNIHRLPGDAAKMKDSIYAYNKATYPTGKGAKHITVSIDPKKKDAKTTIIPEITPWLAYHDSYFTASFLLKELSKIKNTFAKETGGGFGYLGINFSDTIISAGMQENFELSAFIGPKEYKRLKKAGGMQKMVDLGWIRELGIGMFYLMDFLYGATKNYGVAILLITLIIRGLLFIPSQKSYKHMKETQKKMNIIKPRMETLKKIYKDDPKKMNEETMKLYQEYKINPLGGCLPMLLQLPIFIALYQTLISMVELKGANFALWLKDLSRPDPFYVLPLFMGATMFIQQKMTVQPAMSPEQEQQQKIMLYGMPIFLTFISFQWPSGLLLYWSASNLFGIVQQMIVNKSTTDK